MISLLKVIVFWILLPIAIGIIADAVSRDTRHAFYDNKVDVLLQRYTTGILVELIVFSILAWMTIKQSDNYTWFMSRVSVVWMVFSAVVILGATVLMVLRLCKSEIKRLPLIRNDIQSKVLFSFFVVYTLVATFLVLPNSRDTTMIDIIVMYKNDMVALFHPYTEWFYDSYQNHTNRIELFYAMYAWITDVSINRTVDYILDFFMMIFFFGIYRRIEFIVLYFGPGLKKYRNYMELGFALMLVALLFIDGSLYTAIPQNVYSGVTSLTSCILPMGFAFGIAFISETMASTVRNGWKWLVRMIFLMPVALLMHEKGAILVGIQILIAIMVVIIQKKLLRREIGLLDDSED